MKTRKLFFSINYELAKKHVISINNIINDCNMSYALCTKDGDFYAIKCIGYNLLSAADKTAIKKYVTTLIR